MRFRCAVEVQREIAARNAGVQSERRIDFRIGVNIGDIIIDENDIFGDGVNVAARLEALAEPGGICVSRVVRDQVRDKLSISFEDMGEQAGQEHRPAGTRLSHPSRRQGRRAFNSNGDGGATAAARPALDRRPSV